MRYRLASLLLVLFCAAPIVQAQTPATYADRARLMTDATFNGRIQIACVSAALGVVLEDEATANHATRVRLAAAVLREPEFIARRLATLLAATVTAEVSPDGQVSSPITDAQLLALIQSRWNVLASTLIPAS